MSISNIYCMANDESLPKKSDIEFALKEEHPHGFEREASMDIFYSIRNICLILICAYLFYWSRMYDFGFIGNISIYLIYLFFQSLLLWGSFTLGHDYGHHTCHTLGPIAMYMYDFLGVVHHSIVLLVPYHQWRYSHAKIHHSYTINIDHDEIFYPPYVKDLIWGPKVIGMVRTSFLLLMYRFYLVFGFSGTRAFQHYHWPSRANKYTQQAYTNSYWISLGKISLVLLLPTILLIINSILKFGFYTIFLYYLFPLLIHDLWLIMVTFNHHQGSNVIWINNKKWTPLVGALSSVDRNYFPLVNNLSHHINLHQVHHVWPTVPHYKLIELTKTFRKLFPKLVIRDNSNPYLFFMKEIWHYLVNDFIYQDETNYWYNYKCMEDLPKQQSMETVSKQKTG